MNEKTKNIVYYNFDRKNKWLGIIDYKSLLIILSYIFLIYYFINLFNFNITLTIYLLMFFSIPVIAIFCIGNKEESLIDMIIIIIKFKLNSKIYVRKEYIKKLSNEIYKKF